MNKKLVCFDMDGVIFRKRNFWLELHKIYGTFDEGVRLTEKYLYSDYDKLVEEVVVKLWCNMPENKYLELVESYEYLEGVQEIFSFLKENNCLSAIISASSIDVARRVQRDFGVDFLFANSLIFEDGKVSGKFDWPVGAGSGAKARIIRDLRKKLNINSADLIYVGDSKNDVEAFKEASISIAFNCSYNPLKELASHIVDSDNLNDILPILKKKLA